MSAAARTVWVLCTGLMAGALGAGLIGCVHQEGDHPIDRASVEQTEEQIEPPASAPAMFASVNEMAEEEPEWADNSYCYVCHLNYHGEALTQDHEIGGVGCETCHGVSEQHSADEDGITPPDRMFPQDEINPFCLTCHAQTDIEYVDAHKPLFAQGSNDEHVCTDCHGEHKMAVRTRIWDKDTGELISDDGVRMMYEDSPTRANP